MNLQAIVSESLFKRAQGNRHLLLLNHDKLRRSGGQTLDLSEIFRFVRRDPNQTAVNERTSQKDKEAFRHNSARSMTPLRPWIRKHQIEYLYGFCWQHLANRIGNFATQNARIAYAAEVDFAARASHSPRHSLDA